MLSILLYPHHEVIPSFDIRNWILDILRFVFQNDPNPCDPPPGLGQRGRDSESIQKTVEHVSFSIKPTYCRLSQCSPSSDRCSPIAHASRAEAVPYP